MYNGVALFSNTKFMTGTKCNKGLIIAIVFAALAISGSFVFMGWQMGKETNMDASMLQVEIEKGIENYIAKMQQEQMEAQQKEAEEAQKRNDEMAKNVVPPQDDDHIKGASNAKVTLIEYSDFDCPYCGRFHETAKAFLAKNEANVNWVYRHFPLSFHEPSATNKAIASECAAELGGSGAFWQIADAFYEGVANDLGSEVDFYASLVADAGVSKSAFKTCYESGKYAEKITAQMEGGMKAGVSGTPGNFLYNNETGEVKVVSGAQPIEKLEAALAELLGE